MFMTANFIICPYNYILDPSIIRQMKINSKGAIVVIDEAHNIENVCRESGGMTLEFKDIEHVYKRFESLISTDSKKMLLGNPITPQAIENILHRHFSFL
jgi:Fanconi anemia group J protein